jgi:hypothetical protein
LIGYFRGLNAAFGGEARLRNNGPAFDSHPADILRGYLAAATVRLLWFKESKVWSQVLDEETDKDVTQVRIEGIDLAPDVARKSATIVANTLVRTRTEALEGHALGYIQNWRDRDERIVRWLRRSLTTNDELPSPLEDGFYAAHVVAAAITAAVATSGNLSLLFERMVTLMKAMHDQNPAWGPLFIRHPSSVSAHRSYVRQSPLNKMVEAAI